MRYRKLDDDGDYSFGHGSADLYQDSPEAVAQAVKTRLLLFAGEWFLDTAEGTPWAQAVLGKHTAETCGPALRERILDTEGVTEIVSFEAVFDGETRKLIVNAVIETAYGETTILETL